MPDAGCRMPDAGYWVLDIGCWKLDIRMKLIPKTGRIRHPGQGPPQRAASRDPEKSAGDYHPAGNYGFRLSPQRGSAGMTVKSMFLAVGRKTGFRFVQSGRFFRPPANMDSGSRPNPSEQE